MRKGWAILSLSLILEARMTILVKKMISIRLDEELLELLENVQAIPDSMYFERDRTWLIERAIQETYTPLVEKHLATQPSR